MPYVEISRLCRKYSDGFSLDNISMSLEKGEIYTLMGPSGSGKTSLLRNISGLDRPDSGKVIVDGRDVTDLPTSKRGIGMIFQDLALFPHMTVFDNIAYGLRARREEETEISRRVDELASTLRIEGLLERYPSQVSGGQRQRVALARSVAASPSLLLLDEPLSSLDQQLRADVRSEIKSSARELGLTMIYVTHDHHEGLYMADNAGAMFDGRIENSGKPEELFTHPRTEMMALFFGYNVISGGRHGRAFFPSDFEFTAGPADLSGTVTSSGFEGEFCRIHLLTDSGETVQLTTPEKGSLPKKGEHVHLRLKRVEELG